MTSDIDKIPDFTVLSYNVSYLLCKEDERCQIGSFQKVVECILSKSADIVFLQETHDGYEHFTKLHLSHLYPFQYFYPRNGWPGSGSAVLSKFKLESHVILPSVHGSYYPTIMATWKDIDFFNIHLRAPVPMGIKSIWESIKIYLYRAENIHTEELNALFKHKKSSKIILLGDFNESKCLSLQKLGFTDAIQKSITWYWKLKLGLYLSGSLDHIFYKENQFQCLEQNVDHQYECISDHLPISARFRQIK